jgi:3-hydroxyacyl-CoA dehydrogenase
VTEIHYGVSDNIAIVTLDNPPVNALGHEIRRGIVECIKRAIADSAVEAIVLTGSARFFSAGADIRELGQSGGVREPNLPAVIQCLETCPKPVLAAISGNCLGGGFELAMGAHFRIASDNARLALPEVKMGLLPGAGGTQRLPRAIGAERALDFILKGEPVAALTFLDTPLIDRIAGDSLSADAIAYAKYLAAKGAVPRRLSARDISDADHRAILDAARQRAAKSASHYPAHAAIVDCLEAAVNKPFDEGLRIEREHFLALRQTSTHRALRYAFVAERQCARIPDVPSDTPTRAIDRVAIVGAGTMGRGIAMNFLNAGIPVTLLDTEEEATNRGADAIRQLYAGSVKRGRLSQAQMDKRLGLLTTSSGNAGLGKADLIVEAVFEDMSVKEQVFRHLDQIAKPDAILATNTSTLDVNRIASFTRRPEDVVGTHFFSPANVMRLLEVVRGERTSREVLATIMKLAKTIGKTAVVAGVCDGFIGNRMLEHYVRMAGLMVETGAMPWQVDQALENWGMIMGPFRMGDLAGNDIGWAVRKRRYVERPHVHYAMVADRICEHGRFGQKVGKGWYRYRQGDRTPIRDPEVEEIIADYRRDKGITAREYNDEEIVERCIFALVNEGARILEEGIALRASDIDTVYLSGYGFPRFRGGPMRYADEVGLAGVAQRMQDFEKATGDPFWKPAAMLEKLVREGKNFTA